MIRGVTVFARGLVTETGACHVGVAKRSFWVVGIGRCSRDRGASMLAWVPVLLVVSAIGFIAYFKLYSTLTHYDDLEPQDYDLS